MNFKRKTMSTSYLDIPFGIRTIQRFTGNEFHPNRVFRYKFSVLALTYLAYTCYHMTRKPISVVKAVLHRNCSLLNAPKQLVTDASNESTWCDYAPFDGPDSAALLGTLDTAFLLTYGIAMFASGFIAERVSLRYFLTFGMLLSAIFTYLFGLAKVYDIHSFWYFVFVQAMAGMFQTTGWPGVVTVIGRWFGKSKRGLIFGIWNSHTSIGNILGSVVAGHYVETDWSMSFIMPAFIMGIVGFVLFLFLIDSPEIVGCQIPRNYTESSRRSSSGYRSIEEGVNESDADDEQNRKNDNEFNNAVEQEISHRPSERTTLLPNRSVSSGSMSTSSNHTAIGFGGALKIPGVIEFSLCLFFSKLVSYTFLYWLPKYIESSTSLGPEDSANLSTLFDFGGILGAITAGFISDYSGMSACTCSAMLSLAVPMLLIYQTYGATTIYLNVILLFLLGILVNGPYALITTSVSAELGQHSSLEGNSKALATVTAIIDGTGSLGAAVGPFLAGFFSSNGWESVFYMLVMADLMALLLLIRLVTKEISKYRRNPRID